MSEEFSFPDYEGRIFPLLEGFGGTRMERYGGQDITPLWDLSGRSLTSSYKYLYAAPKIEKIVAGVQCYSEKIMTYTTAVWPDDEHALPVFSSFWAENHKGSYFLVDFYPLVDCILDLEYLETYYDPLDEVYEKALEYFPEKVTRDPDWFRALASPYYISADFRSPTRQTQDRVLEIIEGYLKVYLSLWEKDRPRDPEYMKPANRRKNAVKQNFREKDPGGVMVERAVGQEMCDLTMKALF